MQFKHAFVAGVFFVSLVAVAMAQNSGPTLTAGTGAEKRLAARIAIPQQLRDQTLASELLGQTVYSRRGVELGHVSDLLIGRDGSIAGMILTVGAVFGIIGGRQIGVPFHAADIVTEKSHGIIGIRINLSEQQVEDAPTFRNVGDRYTEGDRDIQQSAVPHRTDRF
jgi:sporulation protein YlmC with PRC-barrel domain